MPPDGRVESAGVLVSSLAVALSVLPPFLTGASSELLLEQFARRPDLLGLCVAAFFVASGVCALPGGRVVDRVGARTGLMIGLSLTAGGLVLSLGVSGWRGLGFALACAGVGNAFTQPAANKALMALPVAKQPLYFGIKQAAIPLSTLCAGVLVGLLGRMGWRVPYIVALVLVLCLLVAATSWRPVRGTRSIALDGSVPRSLMLLAVGVAAAIASATALSTFLVPTVVERGGSVEVAAAVLVAGSIAGIFARVGAGWLSGRRQMDPFTTMGTMILIGGAATLVLAVSGHILVLGAAVLVAFGLGWGWNGIAMHTATVLLPARPATATSVLVIGTAVGAAAGPVLFGAVATAAGYGAGWVLVSLLALGAVIIIRASGASHAAANAASPGGSLAPPDRGACA